MNIKKIEGAKFKLRGVDFWTVDGVSPVYDIEFDQNKIVSMTEVDRLSSLTAIPLGFDVQAHLRVPGQAQKETAETGLKAALVGGYAGVLSMPNTKPVIDSPEVLRQAQVEVSPYEKKYGVRAFFTSSLSKNLEGQELVDFRQMKEAGALAFTDDGLGLAQDDLMSRSLESLSEIDSRLLQHSEMPGHGGELAPGRVQEEVGAKAYPDDPEIEMLDRDLKLLEKYPRARYHLLHATSKRAVERIIEAKEKGLKVSAEVSPHHLFFCNEDIQPDNTSFKMNPPLRSSEDRKSLQEAVFEGGFDFVATDHAPHAQNEKGEDFSCAAFGTIGLETTLPVLLHFYQRKKLNPQRLVEIFSKAPQDFLGLQVAPQKFETGSAARFCLIRPDRQPTAFEESQIASLSKNSCFLGAKLPRGAIASVTSAGLFTFEEIEELSS